MQKLIVALIGLTLVGFGGYRQLVAPAVSAADQARCEALVQEQQGNSPEALEAFLPKCSEPGMVAMMDAQTSGAGAQEAAARIAAANQGDFSNHMIDWALIGAGLVMLAGSAAIGRRRA